MAFYTEYFRYSTVSDMCLGSAIDILFLWKVFENIVFLMCILLLIMITKYGEENTF